MGDRSWRRVLGLLPVLVASACTGMGGPATPVVQAPPVAAAPTPAGPPAIALLLPLTGPKAELGQAMLKAAQLALAAPGAPVLDVKDTGGDPVRAGTAAAEAIASGDKLILGPLTAEETLAVSTAANGTLPVLAFTSDPAVAAPGVWPLGLTPGQQVRRLLAAAREDGRTHVAALLPQGALGDALQSALMTAATEAGMDPPAIARTDGTPATFTEALKTLSNYATRRGDLAARIKALRDQTDPAAAQEAARLAAKPVSPPPFDALLIGETGDTLAQGSEVLAYYDVSEPQVRVMGPALWGQQAAQIKALAGAWYAALDPAPRAPFVAAYQAKYGVPPPPFADYAFDAAAIARVLAGEHDFSAAALARAEGFTGVDGALLLLPDGHVRRALAVWQIGPGGARIVSPAPAELQAAGS